MSEWATTTLREEYAAAAENLAALRHTLERTEQELDYIAEQFGEGRAASHRAQARVLVARAAGAAIRQVGDGGYLVVAELQTPEADAAARDMKLALAEARAIDEAEGPLLSRQAVLERRKSGVRRAIRIEEPRVAGLAAEVERLDAPPPEPEPEPVLALPSPAPVAGVVGRSALAGIAARFGF